MVRRSWRWVAVVMGVAAIVAVACTADDSPSSTAVDGPVSAETDVDGPTLDPDILLPPDADEEPPPELFPPTPPPGVEGLAADGAAAANEDSVPLPEWTRDAIPVRLALVESVVGERILTSQGCTACDVGDVQVGWLPLDAESPALSPVLFSNVASPQVSQDGQVIALLGCRATCIAKGSIFEEMPWIHLSTDAGWHWMEVQLPPGLWTLAEATDDGSFVAERWEVTGSFGFDREIVERVRFEADGTAVPDPGQFSGRFFLSTRDEDGNLWAALRPDGARSGRQALFREDVLIRDYSPYSITSLDFEATSGKFAVSLSCVNPHDCHPDFESNAFVVLLDIDGRRTAAIRIDVSGLPLVRERRATDPYPGTRLEWRGTARLEGIVSVFSQAGRPIEIDLEAGVARVFGLQPIGVGKKLALSPVQPRTGESVIAEGCVPVRRSPREGEVFARGCLTNGAFTGESAVDAAGGEWVFISGDEGAGWARAEDVGL